MINIIEIQQKMVQGKTEPWLCLGDDQTKFVVKRASATFKGCLYEWIAANLGQSFGLPIPDFALVSIDEALVEFDIDLYVGLGAGTAFGSSYKPNLQEVNVEIVKRADRRVLKDLYMFDYWIKNADRTLSVTGGNPNLYYDVVNDSLVVFDHNLAFDAEFDTGDHKNVHVASSLFKGQTDLFEPDINKGYYYQKFQNALDNLDAIIECIPEDWVKDIPNVNGEIDRIKVTLGAFEKDDFWRALV